MHIIRTYTQGLPPEQPARPEGFHRSAPCGEFQAVLAREIDKGTATTRLDQGATGGQTAASARELTAPEARMMRDMEALLSQFEEYASRLTRQAGMKDAYPMLERITQAMDSMRKSSPSAIEASPELGELMNELDALAVTETYKFNRGDYA